MTLSRHAMVGVAQFVHQDWKPVVKEGVNDTFELCFTFIFFKKKLKLFLVSTDDTKMLHTRKTWPYSP